MKRYPAFAVGSRLYTDEGTVDPIHLPSFAKIKRLCSCFRMDADNRLRLRLVAGAEFYWGFAGANGNFTAPNAGFRMNTDQ